MTKLRTLLLAAVFGFATTPLMADSSDFSGPYIGVQATAIGIELDGQYTDNDSVVTKGTGGAVLPIAGADIGFGLALGDSFVLGLGATMISASETISKADDASDAADVTLKLKDHTTLYLMPTFVVSDSSALYLKIGTAEADLSVTGNVTGKPNDLEGTMWAVGTKTVLGSFFINTEAGVTDYDKITLTGIGTASSGTDGDGTMTADPTAAHGSITIGVQF